MTPLQFLDAVEKIVTERPGLETGDLFVELQKIDPSFSGTDLSIFLARTSAWFLKDRGIRTETFTRFYKAGQNE